MFIKTWRFITILLTSLTMSLSVSHLFEMPQRLGFEPELWAKVTVYENIFKYFGSIGAFLEVGSILTAVFLVFLVRQRGVMIFYMTLFGAIFLGLALVVWLLVVAPANAEFVSWMVNPIPPDFESWRRQWEYGHAVRAVIHIFSFCLLLFPVIAETPKISRTENEVE